MAGKPQVPRDQVHLGRTRSRRPRELAERAAAARLAATPAAQAGATAVAADGARVFTLYGQAPVVPAPVELEVVAEAGADDGGTALSFYRRLGGCSD